MKKQTFKFDHMTAVYHGEGQYTLTADDGYVLQSGDKQSREVLTKDYTRWKAVAAPAGENPKKRRRKSPAGRPVNPRRRNSRIVDNQSINNETDKIHSNQ